MSAWATMPTSLPFSTTGSRRLVAGHELERLFEVFVGLNTDEVPRVDVPDRRHLRVCGLGDHSRRDVSVGELYGVVYPANGSVPQPGLGRSPPCVTG
jgi:hypothetical protein